MTEIDKLIELFKEFPGIGPRQAKRFVYFLLSKNQNYINQLSKQLSEIKSIIKECEDCHRFFPSQKNKSCEICLDKNRDKKTLMLVTHDIDLENIERTKSFNGYYFVLGGTVPILDKTPDRRIRQSDLMNFLERKMGNGLEEIIIAVNFNPEGENTLFYLKNILESLIKDKVRISTLGKGLSTGTELEYSDPETIKNALKNRQ